MPSDHSTCRRYAQPHLLPPPFPLHAYHATTHLAVYGNVQGLDPVLERPQRGEPVRQNLRVVRVVDGQVPADGVSAGARVRGVRWLRLCVCEKKS
jgi:hypothetical protein